MPQISLKGEQWDICGRCGSPYPLSQLVKQNGMLVCTVKPCWDDTTFDIECRQRVIADLLSDGSEAENPLQEIRAGDDDVPRFF